MLVLVTRSVAQQQPGELLPDGGGSGDIPLPDISSVEAFVTSLWGYWVRFLQFVVQKPIERPLLVTLFLFTTISFWYAVWNRLDQQSGGFITDNFLGGDNAILILGIGFGFTTATTSGFLGVISGLWALIVLIALFGGLALIIAVFFTAGTIAYSLGRPARNYAQAVGFNGPNVRKNLREAKEAGLWPFDRIADKLGVYDDAIRNTYATFRSLPKCEGTVTGDEHINPKSERGNGTCGVCGDNVP
jgi:hypothetical protein|nr:MAG: hypothetical protein J07AB56_02640 [Candidatus Nanosalinarum sp. J07AB56]